MEWHGRDGRVDNVQRDGSNVSDTSAELGAEIGLGDIQDGWGENGARVVHVKNVETVLEGTNVQHVQQGSLGLTDLGASRQQIKLYP